MCDDRITCGLRATRQTTILLVRRCSSWTASVAVQPVDLVYLACTSLKLTSLSSTRRWKHWQNIAKVHAMKTRWLPCCWDAAAGFVTPSSIHRVLFSINFFVCMYVCIFLSFFLSFFVSKITRKRLHRFAWNFQGKCGVTLTTWFNFGSSRRNRAMPRR